MHEAAKNYRDECGELVDVRWNCTIKVVREVTNGNKVDVIDADGRRQKTDCRFLSKIKRNVERLVLALIELSQAQCQGTET